MVRRYVTHFSTSRLRGALWAGSTLLALLPVGVAAHERWFTPEGPYWDPEWGRLWSLPVLFAVVSAAAAAILGVQAAIALIYEASQLDLFVPNIDLPENALGVGVAGVAIVAGFSFITGVLTRVGALLTLGLFLLAFAFGSWYEALEQVVFVGIAIYLVAVGRGVVRYGTGEEEDRTALSDRLLPFALPALRIGAGLSILILAFTEKLLAPDLGVAFLEKYPRFNFMQELGVDWFTDRRFVFAAGIVEATAGVALLSGYLPRVVILALWIPFNLGIAFLPPQELIGHLPILSTMYVLLVRGTEGIPPKYILGGASDEGSARKRATPVQRPASEPLVANR